MNEWMNEWMNESFILFSMNNNNNNNNKGLFLLSGHFYEWEKRMCRNNVEECTFEHNIWSMGILL